MTRRGALLTLGALMVTVAGAFVISRPFDPAAEATLETECDSCTARHKDKIRLREALSNTEPESQ